MLNDIKTTLISKEEIDEIVKDLKSSATINHDSQISYPGERAVNNRKENSEKGIPVSESVWNEILNL